VPRILIVGGGYAGFYTAKKLEKWLDRGEAEVVLVDPLPYMTYQPFLPEVAAGSIEPRHAVVLHRRHLRKTRVITAAVTGIDHARRTVTIAPQHGEAFEEGYDQLVIAAGAVSRTFPIPGVAEEAYGLKNIEEAAAIRDRLTDNFADAAVLPPGPLRDRLLTVVVVGGGFAGIEVFGELRSLATALVRQYPEIDMGDVKFHLVEAAGRIMPEVSLPTSHWVIDHLAQRDAVIHLETQLVSAAGGRVELSTGEAFGSELIVWTAGVMASPMLRGTDLPIEDRGRLRVRADLRAVTQAGDIVEGAWGAGDAAAVPDLTGDSPLPDGSCVPNAQHAVRQAKVLARNLVAELRGEQPREYFHRNQGAVAGLGLYSGVFQRGRLAVKGFLAWGMHRGYHGLAMPMWERKLRVFGNWLANFLLRRDVVGIPARDTPRLAFETYAARPKGPEPVKKRRAAARPPR